MKGEIKMEKSFNKRGLGFGFFKIKSVIFETFNIKF